MKYLILGSEGQIGSALVEYIKQQNKEVIEFDIIRNSLEDLRLINNKFLESCIKESDFIFFLAFDVGGSKYLSKFQHTFEFIQNNIKIMSNTFELLKKYNKPFVFASSQMSSMQHSPYGVVKSVGEKYTFSLNGVVAKFWNIYGIEKDLEKSHVITDFILKAKKYKHIDVLTDGKETRQFLYSKDCCEALMKLSENYYLLQKNITYDITSFEWTSIIDVADFVAAEFEDVKITTTGKKDLIQNNILVEPNTHILKYWKPSTTLKEGIKKIILNY
jgi:nucleoside-diphosphate-sugar epimerase